MSDRMEQNLFRYIWTHSKRQQVWILIVVALSMPTYFLAFDIPKQIVNGPIQGGGFETPDATQKVLPVVVGNPFGDQSYTLFSGFDLDRMGALVALSLAFLGYVIINGAFKLYINTYKGRLGERMLRRLRYQLVDRVLRFPFPQYRRVRSSEIATMIKDEVDPLGGFIGEAFATPAFLAGQALAALLFIMLQSWALGLVTLAILIVQTLLIPKLRGRLRKLALQRQLTARDLSGRVSEIVDGATDIRLNDSTNFERSDISDRLAKIFFIRFDFYQWKFMVKFINNFLAQFTPFVFYLGGGILAIRGNLDIGQLVAVIAAYKDLPGPIKELIDWDYQRLDVQVKYLQVVNAFDVTPLAPPRAQELQTGKVPPLEGPFIFRQVSATDESGKTLISGLDLEIGLREDVVAIGAAGDGAEVVGDLIARLMAPSAGTLNIGSTALASLPEWQTGRRIGYVGPEPFFAHGTARDALLSGLRHAPFRPPPEGEAMSPLIVREAMASGNPQFDRRADWIDYEATGASTEEELSNRITQVLALVNLEEDFYAFGLRTKLSDATEGDDEEMFLNARRMFLDRLTEGDNAADVEPFVVTQFNSQLTVFQNIVFGAVSSPEMLPNEFPADSPLWRLLAIDGLDRQLYQLGREASAVIVDLFGEVSDNIKILERLDLIDPNKLPDYSAALGRTDGADYANVTTADRQKFIRVALSYCEPRHRLDLLTNELQDAIVKARMIFREKLPPHLANDFFFHDPDQINPFASLQDNILFGRIVDGRAGAVDRVNALLREILAELGLSYAVLERGLKYEIGSGGRRLSLSQRQQLGLARVLLRRPEFLIVNRGLNALDNRTVERVVRGILDMAKSDAGGFGVLWITSTESHAALFSRVLKFSRGELVSDETSK
ncbi:ABC transporter transmembrane domain-containing protein [Mesorhizobium sp. YM1C-6-2]|uniref:ABC transporter transmembrane domain-containing protein n=1 Tax=Mesorhizobium sp. YM1C-6-2 TaxID=1827501 RepID=UPI000EF20D34|nr:ABC transporter transmembrane domain-containing protein [Mesorhizobium sp. YM1C-6-2]RLP22090.1 ABC transporter ATP-binding protein [Mesorhizobium sp. YM1C-6-2]